MLQRRFKESDRKKIMYSVGSDGTEYQIIQEPEESDDWIVFINGEEHYSGEAQGECAAYCYGYEEALSTNKD